MTENIVRIAVYLASFALCMYALSALDFNRFLKKGKIIEAQFLMILLAMGLGALVAQFLLALRIVN